MFFIKKAKNQKTGQFTIHAERSSVCMGDDCTAPNPADLEYESSQKLSEFLPVIAGYVPKMRNAWWDIFSDKQLLATVYFDAFSKATYKLHGRDIRIAEIAGKGIFCRYHYEGQINNGDKGATLRGKELKNEQGN